MPWGIGESQVSHSPSPASSARTGKTDATSRGQSKSRRSAERTRTGRDGGRSSFLGLGLRYAQNAPKGGAGLHSVRGQGGPFMKLKGGEFSTGIDNQDEMPVLFLDQASIYRLWKSPMPPSMFWRKLKVSGLSACMAATISSFVAKRLPLVNVLTKRSKNQQRRAVLDNR